MGVEHRQIAVWALFPFNFSDFEFLSKHLHSVCEICDGACRPGTDCTFFIKNKKKTKKHLLNGADHFIESACNAIVVSFLFVWCR